MLHEVIRALPFEQQCDFASAISSSEAAQRTRTVDVMRRLCELAADLGARTLVRLAGPAPTRTRSGNLEADGRQWGAECFAAVADAALRAGVIYCIEPLVPPVYQFIHTVNEAVAIVRAIDSSAVRTMLDCSAAARAEAQAIPDLL